MELDTFRNHFLDEENANEVSSLLVSGQSLSLKNISGSLYALNAYAVIEKTEGFHLFILPDKESALYHLMILKTSYKIKEEQLFFFIQHHFEGHIKLWRQMQQVYCKEQR